MLKGWYQVIFKAHSYQQEAIKRILDNDNYGLLLDMGLGKTIITLTAIEELIYDRFAISKVLIIAPKKVAESTWQDEAKKWDHLKYLRFSTVLGSERARIRALSREADCYVVNRENVVWLCEYYNYHLPFDMCVVDESSSFKNSQAKRFKALRKCKFKRTVILTGTPAPNTLMDLWPQIYLLDAGMRLGKTISEYRRRYFKPDKTNGHIVFSYKLVGDMARKEIYRLVGSCCMSLKAKDYLHLPERIDNVIRVKLDDKAQKIYKRMKKDLVLELGDNEITAANAAALSNKLLQMANGAVYSENRMSIHIHDGKLEALKEITEANDGKPILVFYCYQHDLKRLKNIFPDARELKKPEDMKDWNAGKIKMLLAHPASTAYGLNLQAGGNIIVWFGLTWSLELYQQANARLYRQGQDKPVIVHHLVAEGTIDTQVMAALSNKDAGQEALLAAVKGELENG